MNRLLSPFELILNKAIASDPETHQRLALFDDRSILLVITDLNTQIVITINNAQFKLNSTNADEIDANLTIKATAFSLLKLSRDPDSLFSNDITINGDVQFAKQLQDLLDHFDFDWEAQIAKITGDTLAYPIAHGIRQFSSWLTSSHHSFRTNMAEYLTEEVRMLPVQFQVDDYSNDIDKLRADSDRIEARIKRLEAKLK
jgi:ubiquinone biosynthesis protein UbiJ